MGDSMLPENALRTFRPHMEKRRVKPPPHIVTDVGPCSRFCLDCDGGLFCALEHEWWPELVLLCHILSLIHKNEGYVSTPVLLFEGFSQPLCVALVACSVDES